MAGVVVLAEASLVGLFDLYREIVCLLMIILAC